MRQHLGVTLDQELLTEIEHLRRREERSRFVGHIIRLGLTEYKRLKGRMG